MAQGLFITGFTVAEVLQIQVKAKEFLIEGKTLMQWTDSGSQTTKQFSMPVKDVLEECAYVPIGYFQLWHANADKSYPHSLGSAAHDDVMFAEQTAAQHRRLLPTGVCYHLCARQPKLGENRDGRRTQPRF